MKESRVGMTAAEKILARASGLSQVRAGDIVYPTPDFVMIHDGVVMGTKEELDSLGIDRVFDPDRVMMVTDHDVVYLNERAAARGAFNRKAAAAWGVKHFYDAGRGGHGHIFPTERGLLLPGMFYFDNDRHCTNAGGIGALAIRVGAEMSRVLATGTNWTLVPRTVRVTIEGRLQRGVYGRDLGFHLAKLIRSRDLDIDYCVLEFAGDIEQFSLAERIALCSTPTEIRAIGVFFPPSGAILDYAKARAKRPFTPVYADADARYESELQVDVSRLEPQVALPGGPYKAVDLSSVAGTHVDHAFIGSCGSGTYDDLEIAAGILRDRRVAANVRLLVVPGSEDSTRRLHQEGLLDVFQKAGAFVLPAGCGPCASGRMGLLHSGEVSICTATANAAGRFGARDADIYLGSPATVAASAVRGTITDPREFLGSAVH
jgi:3-isopropylmalate/(R)-2-methylmalate dehydratase large subunit